VLVTLASCSVYDTELLSGAAGGSGGAGGTAAVGPTGGTLGEAGAGAGGTGVGGSVGDGGDGTDGGDGGESVTGGGGASGGTGGGTGGTNGGKGGAGGTVSGASGSGGVGGNAAGSAGETTGGAGAGTAGSAGAAGTAGSSGSAGSAGSAGSGSVTEFLIDNFEDGNHQIALSGQVGYWYSYNDGSSAGTQTPGPSDPFIPGTVTPAITGNPTSVRAANVAWQNFGVWGAGFGAAFTDDPALLYDASQYAGVTFWVRIDTGSDTRVDVILQEARSLAPNCTVCNHHPLVTLEFTTVWTKVYLPFSVFLSDGDGDPSFYTVDPSGLYGIQFFTGAGHTVDLWIDDIAFYTM